MMVSKKQFDDEYWETEDFACPHCGLSSEDYDNFKNIIDVSDRYYGEHRELISLATCKCGKKYYQDNSP